MIPGYLLALGCAVFSELEQREQSSDFVVLAQSDISWGEKYHRRNAI